MSSFGSSRAMAYSPKGRERFYSPRKKENKKRDVFFWGFEGHGLLTLQGLLLHMKGNVFESAMILTGEGRRG